MICLRCGYCCTKLTIIIIKPEYVREKLNLNKLPEDAFMVAGVGGQLCPHLSWDGDTAVCKIHHFPWYKKTPCYRHGQIERSGNTLCRMGKFKTRPDGPE